MAKKKSARQIVRSFNKETSNRSLIQSPYLYLQTTGSDGADGTTDGFHLRWDYLRNLGATHLPKGNHATSTLNFNRQDDFVRLMRSRYVERFPTIIDFANKAPDIVNDSQRFWIYQTTNTNTTVYIHFRSPNNYDAARAAFNPFTDTLAFIEKYGNNLIEAEVKDKLFFAAEMEANITGPNQVMRAEAVSVLENLPVTDLFVSCRKMFTKDNWCKGTEKPKETKKITVATRKAAKLPTSTTPPCCAGKTNLIFNGDFEEGPTGFTTDYQIGGQAAPSHLWVDSNAAIINSGWTGVPYTGKQFLIVDGSTKENTLLWKQTVKVDPGECYCFSGAIATLFEVSPAKLEFIFESNDGSENFIVNAPANPDSWETFEFEWTAGPESTSVEICIFDRNLASLGNDFGLDNLWMCRKSVCSPRIVSENIRFLRLDVNDGYIRKIEFETYEDYINNAK
ncbi:MAG: carbohydrate binding domain-containing protein [Bacteroidota bacterium]